MALEAVLAVRTEVDGAPHVPVGVTVNAGALRALRDVLVDEAREEALRWKGVDDNVFAVRAAEYERLCKVLAWLMPEEEERPPLHLVRRHRELPPDVGPGGST